MLKHPRGAVRSVMDMSLFLILLLSGLVWGESDVPRQYYYINKRMTWSDAQSYCRAKFTDLATVDSMDDVNRMMNTVNDGYSGSVWIGLNRVTLGLWGWSNGENTYSQYSHWNTGEPNGQNINEYCVFSFCGYWRDMPCDRILYFTCYNESAGYIMIPVSKNWTDAQNYCREYHTDLATISSIENTTQLNAVVGCVSVVDWVWIGMFFDYWQWSDQWSLFYRNWEAGYTSQTSAFGNCVAMSTASGKWIQVPCTEQHPFICYRGVRKHIVRLNLSHDGKYDLNDSSVQIAILNKISEKLKSAGLDSHDTVSWRMDEGGEVFHPDSDHTVKSKIKCDSN